MKKFFIGLGVVALVLSMASVTSAQTTEYKNTSLYVTDLSLDKDAYSPGEEVTGSFIIHNINNFDVNDGNYVVSLGANYQDGGIPGNIIESSDRIELPFMAQKSRTDVEFSYQLPMVVGGEDFGINVRSILDSGLELGWDDAQFSMAEGGLSLVDVKYASIQILDEYFATGTGPTVYAEDDASLTVLLTNSDAALELTPNVIIKSQFNNEVVYNEQLNPVKVESGVDTAYGTPLFVDNLVPGVYLGELEMLDAEGNNRISKLEFRYIIGGQIGTIQSIYTDVTAVKRGDMLPLSINVTGTPIDIVRDDANDIAKNAKLEVTIKDSETNKVVGSSSLDLDALNNETHNVEVKIKKSVKNISVEAVLLGSDNQILDEYTISLPGGELSESNNTLMNILFIVIGLIIILAIGIVVKKKANNSDGSDVDGSVGPIGSAGKGIAVLIILMSVIVAGGILFNSVSDTYADTTYEVNGNVFTEYAGGREQNNKTYTPLDLLVVRPNTFLGESYYLDPGEEFSFQVFFRALACYNSPEHVEVFTLGSNVWQDSSTILDGRTSVKGEGDKGNLSWWKNNSNTINIYSETLEEASGHNLYYTDFSPAAYSGYVAPSDPGTYKFYFYIHNKRNTGASGYSLSYINVIVDGGGDLDGACGSANGTNTYTSQPSPSELCRAGVPVDINEDAGGFEWICRGEETDSGQCSADKDSGGRTDPNGDCGPADDAISRSAKPALRSDLCASGAPTEVKVSGSRTAWEWGCEGIISSDYSCSVDIDTLGAMVKPSILGVKMVPSIVNPEGQCTFSWVVKDDDSSGNCLVSDGQLDPDAYEPGEHEYSVKVDPKKSYSVTCTDGVTDPVESETLKCNLNPNITEE